MNKYRIWEEMMTEYTAAPGETGRAVLLGEVEANSHEEAYRLFLQRNPQKANQPLTVKDGLIGVEFGVEK